MANRLITLKEASERMLASLQKLPPSVQEAAIYEMQIGLGGFPRDSKEEKRIYGAVSEEDAARAISTLGNRLMKNPR